MEENYNGHKNAMLWNCYTAFYHIFLFKSKIDRNSFRKRQYTLQLKNALYRQRHLSE